MSWTLKKYTKLTRSEAPGWDRRKHAYGVIHVWTLQYTNLSILKCVDDFFSERRKNTSYMSYLLKMKPDYIFFYQNRDYPPTPSPHPFFRKNLNGQCLTYENQVSQFHRLLFIVDLQRYDWLKDYTWWLNFLYRVS